PPGYLEVDSRDRDHLPVLLGEVGQADVRRWSSYTETLSGGFRKARTNSPRPVGRGGVRRRGPSVAQRVPGDEADVAEQFFVPARAGAAGVARGVPAEAGDFGVGVAGVCPDRYPATGPRRAPLLHRARGEGAFEEFPAVQRVADRARAVVAAVPPAAVPAAVDVGLGAEPVCGCDHGLAP